MLWKPESKAASPKSALLEVGTARHSLFLFCTRLRTSKCVHFKLDLFHLQVNSFSFTLRPWPHMKGCNAFSFCRVLNCCGMFVCVCVILSDGFSADRSRIIVVLLGIFPQHRWLLFGSEPMVITFTVPKVPTSFFNQFFYISTKTIINLITSHSPTINDHLFFIVDAAANPG